MHRATKSEIRAERLSEALRAARADLAQVMELRSTVEPAVTALAAGKTTPEDVARLGAILEAAETENNATRLVELDVEFHVAIADIARNPLVSDLIRMVSDWASSLADLASAVPAEQRRRRPGTRRSSRPSYPAIPRKPPPRCANTSAALKTRSPRRHNGNPGAMESDGQGRARAAFRFSLGGVDNEIDLAARPRWPGRSRLLGPARARGRGPAVFAMP